MWKDIFNRVSTTKINKSFFQRDLEQEGFLLLLLSKSVIQTLQLSAIS